MGMIDSIKSMGELVKQVHDAKLQSELLQRVIDVQRESMELQDHLARLKIEIAALREAENIRANLKWNGSVFMLTDSHGTRPICPTCYGDKKQLIPLQSGFGGEAHYGLCIRCNQTYSHAY